MKKTFWVGLLLVTVSASAALAGALEDRQALMKQFGGTGRVLGPMAKGTTPYDAMTANAQLQILVDGAAKIPGLFPAGSNTDPKSLALPTVWTDMPGFTKSAAKLGTDAKAAMAATDQASFTTAYAVVQSDCGACHKAYRAPPPAAAPAPAPAP